MTISERLSMDDAKGLAARFGAEMPRLHALAHRMLGSPAEADDALQETWLRLSRAEAGEVENLPGWLTTVLGRVCLDVLRSRRARRTVPVEEAPDRVSPEDEAGVDPERDLMLAESMGPAIRVVLDALAPAERVAFVLHDLFGVSFEEIAKVLGRSPEAARQLASRARRRVRGAPAERGGDRPREQQVVAAFLAATRRGDLSGLVALLDPDVVLRADDASLALRARLGGEGPGLSQELRGARAVAETFAGRAGAARLALLDGAPGAIWMQAGELRVAFVFTFAGDEGKVAAIELVADPEVLSRLDVVRLDRQ